MTAGVEVLVCTHRRDDDLRRTLLGIAELDVRELGDVRTIVVDNDPGPTTRQVVEEAARVHGTEVCYVEEPMPGISAARNRALHESSADLVAFLDDDEWPAPGWLEALVRTARETDAEVVVGPVVPVYDEDVETWARSASFFGTPHHPTGTRMRQNVGGNWLLHRRAWDRYDPPFEPALGLTGAEDTHLCLRIVADGGSIVFCDDAVVYERVPAARATAGYLLRQALRSGNSGELVERSLGVRRRRLDGAARGLGEIAVGLVAGVTAGAFDRTRRVRYLRRAAVGIGRIAAGLGLQYHGYPRDGRRWHRTAVTMQVGAVLRRRDR